MHYWCKSPWGAWAGPPTCERGAFPGLGPGRYITGQVLVVDGGMVFGVRIHSSTRAA